MICTSSKAAHVPARNDGNFTARPGDAESDTGAAQGAAKMARTWISPPHFLQGKASTSANSSTRLVAESFMLSCLSK